MARPRLVRAPLTGCALFLLTVGAAAAADFTPGSPGLGDPFFPHAGNGGYDVAHYALTLAYDPATDPLDGTAVDHRDGDAGPVALRSRPARLRDLALTRQRRRRDVHARRPGARHHAAHRASGAARPSRSPSTTRGTPAVVTDPDQSIEGWVPTDDGAFVVGEPQGSPGWYPCNDNPRDKATFDFAVTVPAGLTVMANGVLVSIATSGGRTTWVWRETDPMAPYLATSTLGRFDLTVRRRRRASRLRRRRPAAREGAGAREAAGDRSTSTLDLRPVPVQRGRRDRRRARRSSATRWRRRPSRSSRTCPTRRRSRTSSRTCGSATR